MAGSLSGPACSGSSLFFFLRRPADAAAAADCSAAAITLVQGGKLKMRATFESGSTYFGFSRFSQAQSIRVNLHQPTLYPYTVDPIPV